MSRGPVEKLQWTEADTDLARFDRLAAELADEDRAADECDEWPAALWNLIERAGATKWSLPEELGGEACPRSLLVQRYAQLAGGSLTAVFILSQHDAAVRRLLAAPGNATALGWLREIAAGRAFTTVGISHLTTSQRLGTGALRAVEVAPDRYRLDGKVPWVTAARRADFFVTGATLEDGRQMLFALRSDNPGVVVSPSLPLAALQASCTSEIVASSVTLAGADVLAGPAHDLMSQQSGAVGPAGLETSALALGQARAALLAIAELAPARTELAEPLDVLCDSWKTIRSGLIAQARGEPDAVSPTQIRSQANAIVLRSTQAYLTAKKGTGFLRTEPAQRWARQALFFLVWSCPTPIAQAAIRDLAGLCQVS